MKKFFRFIIEWGTFPILLVGVAMTYVGIPITSFVEKLWKL